MRFDWDEEKNLANQAKHGISFEEVLPLFSQSYEISYDREHSTADEERWIARGIFRPSRFNHGGVCRNLGK